MSTSTSLKQHTWLNPSPKHSHTCTPLSHSPSRSRRTGRHRRSALLAAVARREENEDIDVYIDRHGFDGLATARGYASGRLDGAVTHRSVANELDHPPLEAEIILQALEPIVAEYALTN